jgi:DNA invertase Pin-like site-specific DNA recombinase
MPVYGYARVSSTEQDLTAQINELMAAGAAKVYREKVTGAHANRAELMKVIRRLEPGDVLLVSIGWRDRRATCSTCLPRSTGVMRLSSRCTIRGATPPMRTVG